MKEQSLATAALPARPDRAQVWRLAMVLALCACVVFSPVLLAGYLRWDDHKTIFENPDFTPPRIEKWGHYWTAPFLQLYMPLTYSVWGSVAYLAQSTDGERVVLDPAAYHALSLLLHAACTILVFSILRRLVKPLWAAFFGALFFCVHPLQTESVAWATVASIPLSTAFSLWALLEYFRFSDAGQATLVPDSSRSRGRAALHYIVGTLAFALALLSKSSAIVLPLIVLIIEVILRRRALRSMWPLLLWFLMTAPIAWVTRAVQPARGIHVAIWRRLLVALDALAFYLYKLLLPARLFPDYGRSPRWLFEHPVVAHVTWVAPAVLLAFCLIFWRKQRWIAASSLVFVAGLLPLLGVVPFAFQKFSTIADRYAYMAMLGPAMAVAFALSRFPAKSTLRIATVVCALFAAMSFWQSRLWHDTFTLFDDVRHKNPASLQASYILGQYHLNEAQDLEREGQPAPAREKLHEALHCFEAGLPADPDDARLRFVLGSVFYRLGQYDDAIEQYRVGMNDPEFMAEHGADAYDNLAMALSKSGHPSDAAAAYHRALTLKPDDTLARRGLAQSSEPPQP